MDPEALLDDEKIIYEGKLHWIIFVSPALTGLFILIVTGFILHLNPKIGVPVILEILLAAVVICALFVAPSLLKYLSSWIVVTNKRVIARTGLLSRKSFDMLLVKIEGISVNQDLMGRMLDYGTIVVRGVGGGKEYFSQFRSPAEISKQVLSRS